MFLLNCYVVMNSLIICYAQAKGEIMKPISRVAILLIILVFLSTSIFPKNKGAKYDIKAEFVKYTPNKVILNNPVVFYYRIKNCGKDIIPAKSYDVEFYVDNKLINFDYATAKLKVKNGIIEYATKGSSHYIPKKLGKHSYKLVVIPKKIL